MATSSSSSAQQARQVLASRLNEIRRDAGLTGRQLAALCEWHPSKVSRIENAKTPPSADDLRVWAEKCGASNQTADLIASLRAVQGMWIEWRRMTRGGLRPVQAALVPLYERTHHFRAYTNDLIPGMLQTPSYAEAVFRTVQVRDGLAIDDVDAATDARISRQRLMYEGDRRFAYLIEESALRNAVSGVDVMAGQLGHLLTIGSLPNVSLGIVPMSADRGHWPVESFWIFDDELVNVELVSGKLNIRQPREVALYVQMFMALADQAKHSASARSLITAAIDALG